ncbi:MAG: transporter substrate-binding domain-containing protein [Candidatus Omnitrophota bacterium]
MKRSMGVFVLFMLFLSLMRLAAAETITVAADPWMPYTGDAQSARQGYCIEVLKAIFEPAGYTVDYQSHAWTRDVEEVQAGKIDAIVGAGHSDCPRCIFPEQPIGTIQNLFFVKKGDPWVFNQVSSLAGRRLGVVQGYSYDEGPVDAYIGIGELPDVQKSSGEKALAFNIQKLLAGRVDVIVENDHVIANALKEQVLPEDALTPAGKVNEEQAIYIAFSPVSRERTQKMMKVWADGIAALRGSGKLAEILARYKIADWAPAVANAPATK